MSSSIKKTKIYNLLKSRESEFISTIDSVIPIVENRLSNQIPKLFPEFTLHDIKHSARVSDYMADIVSDLNLFNDFELSLMLIAAIFQNKINFEKEVKYESYQKMYGENALKEIVRTYHSELSGIVIMEEDFNKYFHLNDPRSVYYSEDLKNLCLSHTKEHIWIKNSFKNKIVKGEYDYNLRFIAYLLRIADSLDIDQSRTPLELYKLIDPKGESNNEWRQHFDVTNTKKIEIDTKSGLKNVVFYGCSRDIKMHRKLMAYINSIGKEIEVFNSFCKDQEVSKYKSNLSDQVIKNISTEGFTVSDYRLSLDFKSITELLMGENIYGDKKLGLREIIQNSIDACLVRKEIESKSEIIYKPFINVEINENLNEFIIHDNGIGMSEDVIQNFFLNIGKSFYKSDIFKLNDFDYKPIGAFGVGFLACFMLSEDVTIETRYFKNPTKHTIQLERGDEYIGFDSIDDVSFIGTKIILRYDQVLKEFENKLTNIENFIKTYFVNDDYDLLIINKTHETQIKNSIEPAESNDKNDIIEDISKYLTDTRGYIKIKNSHKFIRKINDLEIKGDDVFCFCSDKSLKAEFNFKDIIDLDEDVFSYMYLPLYSNDKYSDFNKALELLDDDIEGVLKKIESDKNCYIFFSTADQKDIKDSIIIDDENPEIFEGLFIDDIKAKISADCFCPKVIKIDMNIIKDNQLEILEEYKIFNANLWNYSWHNITNKLYLRNILIKNYCYGKQMMVSTIDLRDINLNTKHQNILPDITRNNLLPDSRNILDNSINIAVHLAALERFTLEEDEKDIIIKFIKIKLIKCDHFVKKDILEKYGI